MGTGARGRGGGGGDTCPSSACCREATPPAGLAAPPPGALTKIPSARIFGPSLFSGFLCVRVLRHPSHTFPSALFLIQTLGSEEVRNPAVAESGHRCRWPWSWAPRSCCLSDTPSSAWASAPSWLLLGVHALIHFLLGHLLAHPLPSLLALSSSQFLCDWTFRLGPLKLDSRCASRRPEDP